MDLLLKGVVSGVLVSCVLLLAQTGQSKAAGLAVLFPAITLLSYYFIGQGEGEGRLREVVGASLLAFPVWLVFMGTVYFALPVLDFRVALAAATVAWLTSGGLYLALAA